MDIKEKKKALNSLIKGLKKSGVIDEDTTCGFGDKVDVSYQLSPTPFPSLNTVIGGGFPRGKFTCISGPQGTCKSTLCLHHAAHIQATRPDDVILWLDAENSFDLGWAQQIGVDTNNILFVEKMNSLEEYLNAMLRFVDTGNVDVVVIDSIGGMSPEGEFKTKGDVPRDLRDDTMALQARKFGQWARMATPRVARHNIEVIMIAQVYSAITSYGGIWEVKGGNQLKHTTHLRLMTRRSKDERTATVKMPDGNKKIVNLGWQLHIKVDKSRQSGSEGHEIILPFRNGAGIVKDEAAVLTALSFGLIERSGAWYTWKDERIQGKENVIKHFIENQEHAAQLAQELEAWAENDTIEIAIAHEDTQENCVEETIEVDG